MYILLWTVIVLLGWMISELGRTQYSFGAVVFTLKATGFEWGFLIWTSFLTMRVNGPKKQLGFGIIIRHIYTYVQSKWCSLRLIRPTWFIIQHAHTYTRGKKKDARYIDKWKEKRKKCFLSLSLTFFLAVVGWLWKAKITSKSCNSTWMTSITTDSFCGSDSFHGDQCSSSLDFCF